MIIHDITMTMTATTSSILPTTLPVTVRVGITAKEKRFISGYEHSKGLGLLPESE
jgi:hypothetical protein